MAFTEFTCAKNQTSTSPVLVLSDGPATTFFFFFFFFETRLERKSSSSRYKTDKERRRTKRFPLEYVPVVVIVIVMSSFNITVPLP